MIFGFPDEIFFILVYSGIATFMAVIFGVLLLLVPPTGKTLLKARLSRKKPAITLLCGKASIRAVLTDSICPGWVKTSEGKKFVAPIAPKGGANWSPERDILGKVFLLDGFPCFIAHEADVVAANPEMLVALEAFGKGYSEELQVPIAVSSGNPEPKWEFKIAVPVSPKVLAETVGGLITTEHIDVLEQYVIETELKRRMRSEWGPIIKIALILGMIFVAGLIVLLIAKGALGL